VVSKAPQGVAGGLGGLAVRADVEAVSAISQAFAERAGATERSITCTVD